MASGNRFALLDDEPVAQKPVVAAAPAPAAAPAQKANNQGERAPREGGRGGRGGRGRGGRGGYKARADGESNPHKREFDGHVSRTDYVRGGGNRGRGAKRQGGGRFNTGAENEVAPAQSTETALESLPAADGETPVAEVAAPVEPEEIDTTITLAQFLASKASLLDADVSRRVREAGEDIVEEDFQNAKILNKVETVDDVLGASTYVKKESAVSSGPKLVAKKALPIDVVFAAPAGGRGGFRGGARGGYRGGRGGQGSARVDIQDNSAFPSLGK